MTSAIFNASSLPTTTPRRATEPPSQLQLLAVAGRWRVARWLPELIAELEQEIDANGMRGRESTGFNGANV
jgi:hypothetical protein